MKTIISMLVMAIAIGQVNGQNKVDNTIYKARKMSDQADQAKKAGAKIKSIFGGKKDKEEKANKDTAAAAPKTTDAPATTAGAGTTLISITGIDYPKLKTLNENIRNCKGVQSSKIVFDVATSQIEVAHSGTTEDLMKLVSATSKDIFTDKNITSSREGKITLKL